MGGHDSTGLVDLSPLLTGLMDILINTLTLGGVYYGSHVNTLREGGREGGSERGREGGREGVRE